jgi:hypothetical protein
MGGAGSPPGWNTAAPRRERSERGRGAGVTGAPLRARHFAHRPPPAGSLDTGRSAASGAQEEAGLVTDRRLGGELARDVPLGSERTFVVEPTGPLDFLEPKQTDSFC